MMPIYRRRRLSKRSRTRSSFRVPFDPRVLRFRTSSNNNANIIRPLLSLVQRQHSALVALPARIRQARSEMEKKLEEVNKRLEIFSELNDAYQALIDNLKGVQTDQTHRIKNLESTLERMRREQQPRPMEDEGTTECPSTSASLPTIEEQPIKLVTIATEDETEDEEEVQSQLGQLETEIIYDFVL